MVVLQVVCCIVIYHFLLIYCLYCLPNSFEMSILFPTIDEEVVDEDEVDD